MSKTLYTERIREEIAKQGHVGTDPLHVEAFMRLEHSTLDGLASWQFRQEVKVAIECVQLAGPEMAAATAKSFGLVGAIRQVEA